MGLFRRGRGKPGTLRGATPADREHLEAFARSRRGVEAYIEPRTHVTEMTVALVAADGEWTRRRVPSAQAARDFGNSVGIPVYDVAATGYPSRMREWTARRKAAGQTGVPGAEEPTG
ncbi:MAG: oxidoreductase [Actinomycetota bacterium]|nr:oxidoreductase [Actinomycetota bacterium]